MYVCKLVLPMFSNTELIEVWMMGKTFQVSRNNFFMDKRYGRGIMVH